MARLVASLLILLLASHVAAQTASTSDEQGDAAQRVGTTPVDEPAVDIVLVTGAQENGTLDLTLQLAGDLPTTGDSERQHTHLFMVAYGAEPGASIFQQVSEGRDALAVVCNLTEGAGDLGCEMSIGEAPIRGVSAEGNELSVRIGTSFKGAFEVAASSTLSVPNATVDTGREIIAQDFTPNALPYTPPPDTETAAPTATGEKPWYRQGWIWAFVFFGGFGVFAFFTLRK